MVPAPAGDLAMRGGQAICLARDVQLFVIVQF